MVSLTAAPWILMGPEPHLAHCEHCGATLARPALPCSFDELLAPMRAFGAEHADCRPRVWPREDDPVRAGHRQGGRDG